MGIETAKYEGAWGPNALDSECKYLQPETGNGLDNINNKHWPMVCYSISCSVMPYDFYNEQNMNEYVRTYNFGESFTMGKDYGGVAFLGNTRVGYHSAITTNQFSNYLESVFWQQVCNGDNIVGRAESYSKSPINSPLLDNNRKHHIRLTHNLLGDPAIKIWTLIPEQSHLQHWQIMGRKVFCFIVPPCMG